MSKSVASGGRSLTSWDTGDTFDHENDEDIEAMLAQDIGEVSYFKDMGCKSKEMEHFIKVELPHPKAALSRPDYHAENLFPQWILDNQEWQMTAHHDKANEISELAQISWSDRTQEQNSALIHWLMSVWPTGNQMGYKKCGMMWRVFSLLNFEPSQDIIREGERGLTFYIIISGKAAVLKKGIGQVAMLKTGHSFGELALTDGDDLRGATVRATTPMEILQLHKVDYDHFVKDIQVAERRENFHILKNCVLFNNWTKSKIQKMCNACVRKIFAPGEFIFRQGDPCDAIYFVVDGKIDVYKEVVVVVRNRWPSASGKGQEGISRKKKKPFLVHTLKKEDYFGEQAISQDQLRTVSCVANTASIVLSLDRLEFAHYIENDVAIQVMKNAHDDYVQDKQILNTMIMSCKIRGGPSTTAQLNKCLEIVNDYRPSTSKHVPLQKLGPGTGKTDGPHTSSTNSNAASRRAHQRTQHKKSIFETQIAPKNKAKARSRPNTTGSVDTITPDGTLPPAPGKSIALKRAETMPYESFFYHNKLAQPASFTKDGLLTEDELDDKYDPFATPSPESSQPQSHLHVMKSEHLELVRSKNAPKNFARQFSKMPNCAEELRKRRLAAAEQYAKAETVANGEGDSVQSTSTEVLKPLQDADDDSVNSMSNDSVSTKSKANSYNSNISENVSGVEMLKVITGDFVNRLRDKQINYLVKSPIKFQKLPTSTTKTPKMRLSFNDNVRTAPKKEVIVSVATNFQKSKNNPKITVKEKYIPTIGSIKSVELKSDKGRRIKSDAIEDISGFVSAHKQRHKSGRSLSPTSQCRHNRPYTAS